MKTFITGEAGFIARNFSERCLFSKKHEVLNHIHEQYYDYWRNMAFSNKQQKEINVFDPILKKLIEESNPDLIIHTASIVDKQICEDKPEFATHINVEGTINICKIAKSLGIPVLYLSSYDTPTTIHGFNKKHAQEIVQYYGDRNRILVVPYLFGKYDLNGAVTRIFSSIHSKKDFDEININPEYIKPYLYIEDFLDAFELYLDGFNSSNHIVYMPGVDLQFEQILNYIVEGMGLFPNYELLLNLDMDWDIHSQSSDIFIEWKKSLESKFWNHFEEMKKLYDNKRTN